MTFVGNASPGFDKTGSSRKDPTVATDRGGATGETVGERLRRLRRDRGLSQRELAGPGVSYAYISRIEAGTRTPSVKALRTLARALGVSSEYLETGTEVRDSDGRELRLTDAELMLRLDDDSHAAEAVFADVLDAATAAGDVR
jgi:transcriptional regulator with XRE-family HTH domain